WQSFPAFLLSLLIDSSSRREELPMTAVLSDYRLEQAIREPEGSKILSDAFVFFGASGDLAYKKIFPALQNMVRRSGLNIPIIGVPSSKWTLEQLQNRARESLEHSRGGVDQGAFTKLLSLLKYIDGDYRDPATFERLRTELGEAERPLHYLAIPPSL